MSKTKMMSALLGEATGAIWLVGVGGRHSVGMVCDDWPWAVGMHSRRRRGRDDDNHLIERQTEC